MEKAWMGKQRKSFSKLPMVVFACLTWVLLMARAEGGARRFEVSAGYGFSRVDELVFYSVSDSGKELAKMNEGERIPHSGFDVTAGYAFSRWFGAVLNVSGAYYLGAQKFLTPPTLWLNGVPLLIPGAYQEGSRSSHALLAGIRIKDNACAWPVVPSAYVLAGIQRQSLKVDPDGNNYSQLHDDIFFQGGALTQTSFAMAMGAAADVRVYKSIGLRVAMDYQPVFAGDKTVLGIGDQRRLLDEEKRSFQKVTLNKGVRHNIRAAVGPYFAF
jgi:hypothetical protein